MNFVLNCKKLIVPSGGGNETNQQPMFIKPNHEVHNGINFIFKAWDEMEEILIIENPEVRRMFPTPFMRDMRDLMGEILHIFSQREQTNQ